MTKLTAAKVKSITAIGMTSDGGGLHLKVQKSKDGSSLNKSWIYRWGAQGRNSIGLGSLNDFSLAELDSQIEVTSELVKARFKK